MDWKIGSLQSKKKRADTAQIKLFRLLASYTLLNHRTNQSTRQKLNIPNILVRIYKHRSN